VERLPLKEYARREGISLYQALKMVNQGVLKAETIEENGTKIRYVFVEAGDVEDRETDDSIPCEEPIQKAPSPIASFDSSILEKIASEVAALRQEVARLQDLVSKCCAKT